MSKIDIARAWKDPLYRRSLSHDQLARLPGSPAGQVEVHAQALREASGAGETMVQTTAWFCTLYTFLARCC